MLPLCDLDGVLADFTTGANVLHGHPTYLATTWDWYEDWGMTSKDFWEPIKKIGYCFYQRYVPPYPWLPELLRYLKSFPEFVIVTANPQHPGLAASKTEWIKEHLGDVPVITTNKGGSFHAAQLKALLAGPDRVLIDDSDDNVSAFRAAGGTAITFPQPWNKAHGCTGLRLEHIKNNINGYFGAAA